jgi:site-specific DNA-methyltransferase (adenine-specific)
MLAFGGSRTWHRLASAIEDAGFEVRDSIAWLYGSGFPKSLNLPDGRGTALKPAFEPIVVGRKPLAGTVAQNVTEHGTGALNIDGCRIATSDKLTGSGSPPLRFKGANSRPFHETAAPRGANQHEAGRWPANVALDESAAAELDQQSGTRTSGLMRAGTPRANRGGYSGPMPTATGADTYGDIGGASRFFYTAKASADERPEVDGIRHPTVKPLSLMRWLVRLVTPPGGIVLDPFAGSGTTAEACVLEHLRCIAIEREASYLPLIVARLTKPIAVGFDFEAEEKPTVPSESGDQYVMEVP